MVVIEKPWSELTDAQKRQVYDEILASCKETAAELERDINEHLATRTTLRVGIEFWVSVDVNDDAWFLKG